METPSKKRLQRYLLSGAGIGLYFGWFFRPVSEPNFLQPILLGVLVGIATAVFRIWRIRPFNFIFALRQTIISVFSVTIFFVILEFRHYANAFGGKFAVILLMTVTGLLFGLVLAYFQKNTVEPTKPK